MSKSFPASAKSLVVLGMFDLSRLDSARPIRIHHFYTALQALTPATLLSGNRTPRRWAIARYLLAGGLRRTRAIYVEASTSTATEMDILFLALARHSGIPILVYIPDAYQLFPGLFPRRGWKVKLLDWGWQRTIAAYYRTADMLLFPSMGVAACFDHSSQFSVQARRSKAGIDVLPPAGQRDREWRPPSREPPRIVFAGGTNFRYGSDLLLQAMEKVAAKHVSAHLHLITNNADYIASHPARHAPWLTVTSLTVDQVAAMMPTVSLAVIPLRVNPYNNMAIPLKLFDFMSHGCPLVVTACHDMAALVNELRAGLVVEDAAEALANGMIRLIENPDLAARFGENGYRAIQTAHSWSHRAQRLMKMIEKIENSKHEPRAASKS